MLGWVAVTNKFSIETGILFMIQFFWQFPHFWAIGWVSHDDYKNAVLKFILYKINKPVKARIEEIIIASLTLILPEGKGLFIVLSINKSLFLSIIWLKPLEEPTTRNPPKIKRKNV